VIGTVALLAGACAREPQPDASVNTAALHRDRVRTSAAPAALSGARLYVWPQSAARRQVEAWRTSRPRDAADIDVIASQPQAIWLGDWTDDPRGSVHVVVTDAARSGTLPIIVAYHIPGRDCGGHSAGGAASGDAYRRWIESFAAGIGDARVVVILEPDAIAETQCLSARELEQRYELLRFAVETLTSKPQVSLYVDAGNASWLPAEEVAGRLERAGIAKAAGFALNVSNFAGDSVTRAYGDRVSQRLGGIHYIIDSGRNGRGAAPDAEWCNPPGRALGRRPTTVTGHALLDAYLWIKPPGESDGACNGGPAAGTWWAEYALGLVRRTASTGR